MRPPPVQDLGWTRLDDPSSVGSVRRAVVHTARAIAFREDRVAEVALAATELATNAVVHATAGAALLRVRRHESESALEMVLVDSGPGMADVADAMRDGMSTNGTLGIGLGAVSRLANRLDIHSDPRRGSVTVATFRPDARTADAAPAFDGITRPIGGEEVCGDAWSAHRAGDRLTLLLADGLGHGTLAADASRRAVDEFDDDPWRGPAELLRVLHGALGGSRGAAVTIVDLDLARRSLVFAGVGNVAGRIVGGRAGTGTDTRGLAAQPGIVGHQMREVREVTLPLERGDLVVLHSDGLTSKWDLSVHRGALARSCDVVAALLLREAGLRQDDAAVAVVRVP
jgi:anti-sigma regulatory factor (Ser/Thr protein kinase)